jgi:hypothetical protein
MPEWIIELLLSLSVALAGAAGIETATTTPHGIAPDAAADVELSSSAENAMSATATALEVLARVMASAPEAAADGLSQATESVSSAGPDDASGAETPDAADAAPVDTPAGPPDSVPAGPPDGVPGGPAAP